VRVRTSPDKRSWSGYAPGTRRQLVGAGRGEAIAGDDRTQCWRRYRGVGGEATSQPVEVTLGCNGLSRSLALTCDEHDARTPQVLFARLALLAATAACSDSSQAFRTLAVLRQLSNPSSAGQQVRLRGDGVIGQVLLADGDQSKSGSCPEAAATRGWRPAHQGRDQRSGAMLVAAAHGCVLALPLLWSPPASGRGGGSVRSDARHVRSYRKRGRTS